MKDDIKRRIDDLMVKSTIDKEAAKKHGLDNHYAIFHKGWQHKRPAYMVGKSGSYFGWSKHIEKELKRLTDDWLEGDCAGVSLPQLVSLHQAGEKNCFDVIKGRLEGEIKYIMGAHGMGLQKAVFVGLDGQSGKKGKRGKVEKWQRIDAIYENNFTEQDRKRLIEKSLQDALNTYRASKSGFKTWFKIKFNDDVVDMIREYRNIGKVTPKTSNYKLYEEKHKTDKTWDYSEIYEKLPADYLENLNDDHKRLLMIKVRAVNDRLSKKAEAALLGVGKDKHKRIEEELENEYIKWHERTKGRRKPKENVKIEPRNYFDIADPTPYETDRDM